MTQSEYQRWHGRTATGRDSGAFQTDPPSALSHDRGAFTVDEFCGWARIGRSKFYQEVQEGRLRLRKIGRKSVVTVADADAWLNGLPEAGVMS